MYATIENGKIVSGGMACQICGKPTLSMCLVDYSGKSTKFEPRCIEHSIPVSQDINFDQFKLALNTTFEQSHPIVEYIGE